MCKKQVKDCEDVGRIHIQQMKGSCAALRVLPSLTLDPRATQSCWTLT